MTYSPIPAYRALSNARIEQIARDEERRVLGLPRKPRRFVPADTSDRAEWNKFITILKMRKMRARWGNTQAAKLGRVA